MAAVTICSDFGAQENKVCRCFHCFQETGTTWRWCFLWSNSCDSTGSFLKVKSWLPRLSKKVNSTNKKWRRAALREQSPNLPKWGTHFSLGQAAPLSSLVTWLRLQSAPLCARQCPEQKKLHPSVLPREWQRTQDCYMSVYPAPWW